MSNINDSSLNKEAQNFLNKYKYIFVAVISILTPATILLSIPKTTPIYGELATVKVSNINLSYHADKVDRIALREEIAVSRQRTGALLGSPKIAKQYAKRLIKNNTQHNCLVDLWNSESGWRTKAKNSSSGAYGIPQALPGNKMAAMGKDWKTNYKTQVKWGLKYIDSRYGSACQALSFKKQNGWY